MDIHITYDTFENMDELDLLSKIVLDRTRVRDVDGFIGTVRYVGPVASAKDSSEVYLGVSVSIYDFFLRILIMIMDWNLCRDGIPYEYLFYSILSILTIILLFFKKKYINIYKD